MLNNITEAAFAEYTNELSKGGENWVSDKQDNLLVQLEQKCYVTVTNNHHTGQTDCYRGDLTSQRRSRNGVPARLTQGPSLDRMERQALLSTQL